MQRKSAGAFSRRMKVAVVAAGNKRRETMTRLINSADLQFKSDSELIEMIRIAWEELHELAMQRPEYAATLASVRVIKRELEHRRSRRPKP